jgi:predicted dehydrogenase
MVRQSRRRFLKTLAAAATVTIAGTKSSGRVLGANEALRIGVAGLNGRGKAHTGGYLRIPGVQITYLIDPDSTRYTSHINMIEDSTKAKYAGQTVQDVRRALDDRNLDAISIATPNHWHALMTIWAAERGKHVYVEKPMSHNVHEGRIAVQMAEKHNVIVQHGTQSRSSNWANAIDVIHQGKLGKLLVARGLCYKTRNSIGSRPVSDPPSTLNFDIWCGPAPLVPFHANLVHYNWHWFWEFGNGDIGNQGVHQYDIARWGIKDATLPRSVISLGGRFGYTDQGETPNTQLTFMDFGETKMIFEVRGLRTTPLHGATIGNLFHCEEGTVISATQFIPKGKTTPEPLPRPDRSTPRGPGGGDHFRNFVEAVRSRRRADLNADILEGHYSSALCHLGNISYRLGENVPASRRNNPLGDNADARESLQRMEEHLVRGNNIKLEDLVYKVGRKLELDVGKENFVTNAEANRLLTRNYRTGYVVPERVN